MAAMQGDERYAVSRPPFAPLHIAARMVRDMLARPALQVARQRGNGLHFVHAPGLSFDQA
ncbi:hypothetical protein SDC9_151210 [bioreactor metagenome]|uniref:Uncharacterized protein n=1 Tax=bioreactor metagenome TaxID=1076179 RepID=A0A645EPM8_9ZZZZ